MTDKILYQEIASQLADGLLVPFFGAGASAASSGAASGGGLAKELADSCSFPGCRRVSKLSLAEVASFYELTISRARLESKISETLSAATHAGEMHRIVAGLKCVRLVVTTNYDQLIEQAFDEAGRQYDLVVFAAGDAGRLNSFAWKAPEQDLKFLSAAELDHCLDLEARCVIVKVHGGILPDPYRAGFVLTEEDYVRVLARGGPGMAFPRVLLSYCLTRGLLFLGYRLEDWNVRVMLLNLREAEKRHPASPQRHYAVSLDYPESKKELWKSRGVSLYRQDLSEFGQALRDQLKKGAE